METPSQDAASGDRLNPVVFYGSVIGIVLFALWTMIFTESASVIINTVLGWISATFGWYYFLAILAYLIFVVAVGLSRFGKIRLGPEHSRPDFNMASWAAMLFAAGIGIDLLFFCIAEPLTQFLAPPEGEPGTVAAARHAMELTFLHWGLSGWGIYTLVGMSLAFFSYRHNLPLTIRSALYPIFGKRIYGPIGHSVDIAAVLGTVFGIATSLGIGVIQLNFGLNYMFDVPETTLIQAVLVIMIVFFAAVSAVTGVERGIRRLSEFNMLLALLLLLFVLFSGNTLFLLNTLVTNIGDYFSNFFALSTQTYSFDPPVDWLNGWTLFFWAWWIAWGPFVGLFLARISRGRTIREFVAGTLFLPLAFMMAWMSIMGNSAIDQVMAGGVEFGDMAMNVPESSIYLFLENLPWTGLTTTVVTVLAIVFFVTSGDSGALVLSNFTSILEDVTHDAPIWMRILWAAVIGVLTLALLMAGGLGALQSAVVVTGLPFSVVLFFMMFGLLKALRVEGIKEDSHRASLSGSLSGRSGSVARGPQGVKQRLSKAMAFPSHKQARRFLNEIARPAMVDVRDALEQQGVQGTLVEGKEEDEYLALNVALGDEQNFTYQIWLRRFATPSFALRAQHSSRFYYRLEVYLMEGSQEYDLSGYNKEQVTEDILDQYERHLHFLHLNRQAPGDTLMPDDPQQPSV
nr:choline BCCT transporter BetT [uncultured Halomonas sp.]